MSVKLALPVLPVPVAGAAAGATAYAASGDGSGKYNAVPAVNASREMIAEKSDWAKKQDLRKRKTRMWIVIAIITVVMIGSHSRRCFGCVVEQGRREKFNGELKC